MCGCLLVTLLSATACRQAWRDSSVGPCSGEVGLVSCTPRRKRDVSDAASSSEALVFRPTIFWSWKWTAFRSYDAAPLRCEQEKTALFQLGAGKAPVWKGQQWASCANFPDQGYSCFNAPPFRQTASALGAMSGKAGGLMAPLLNMMVVYHWSIPPLQQCFTGRWGARLPAPWDQDLPESADKAESNRWR